ncbi:MAG: hypothetical protein H7287_06325, partial [Thermoleophilia bacterium]|nr:hypothetical protein [Thermoleophilia bacterium]
MSEDDAVSVGELLARVNALEARIVELEAQGAGGGSRRAATRGEGSRSASAGRSSASPVALDTFAFTTRYVPAQLTVEEGWIELHEHSARPQLQRLIREVVEA